MQSLTAVDPPITQLKPYWYPLCVGLVFMLLPTYFDLYRLFWQSREGSYAPVILALIIWFVWRERSALYAPVHSKTPPFAVALVGIGLVAYVLGRSQSFYSLEVVSQIPLLIGVAQLQLGSQGARRLWFPCLLLFFVVPIPGSILDQILIPLKEFVSRIVDDTLHKAGYPIARHGVVLMIGPYTLLIADACAGLNSIISVLGIGLIYAYLTHRTDRWLGIALVVSAVPIALMANVVRVASLVLVTYHYGDEAGSAFHDRADLLEIALAFGSFFFLDGLLSKAFGRHGAVAS
jgi:exosortase B